jgi:EF-P beta-lysylation protein EpmB
MISIIPTTELATKPTTKTAAKPNTWRTELSNAIRSSQELLRFVGLEHTDMLQKPEFPVLVPRGFAERMQHGDPFDPLLLQVLATSAELDEVDGFVKDPLAENVVATGVSPAPALIHKYHGRALLITTSGCAVNCRYCFRRHFPYSEHRDQKHAKALAAISADPTITEIILSGGDPLLLDDQALGELIANLELIPHLKRLRIHSRIPVVLPERITSGLLAILRQTRLKTAMVIHSNHPKELNKSTANALTAIRNAEVLMLNQAVLLKGVNDKVDVQVSLAEELYNQGVQPYYLHMPDYVAGTAHFFVDNEEARLIYKGMQKQLPGYLLAKLVREIPGENAKQIVQL